MPTLADLIVTASDARWFSVLIHPSHFDQAHDEFLALGAPLITYGMAHGDKFMGVVAPNNHGILVGTSSTVPRRSVAHIANGDSLIQVAERTQDALDRLAAGVDRLAEQRTPRSRHPRAG